jgi:Na+/proline symporter
VQGVAVIVLLVVLLIAIIVYIDIPPNALAASGAGDATSGGVIAFVSLVIGVTSATMFHSGFWQRLWAAGDERKLRHGIFAANVMTIAVLILMGFSGMLALALYGGALFAPNYVAYLSTFMLIQQMPMGWHVIAVVAVVCMVSSTADTLQNAFAATFSAHPRMTIPMAQLLTVALNVPAIVLATLNLSVLSLFNLGNLLCCSALVPVAMGLWPRTNPVAALVGVGVGIVTVVLVFLIGGEVDGLGAEAGVARIYFQYDVTSPTLVAAFVLSPALSGLTTLVGSLIWKHEFAGFAATKAAAPGAQPKAVAV